MSKNFKYVLKFDSKAAFDQYKASHLMEGNQIDSNIKSVDEIGTIYNQPLWASEAEEQPPKVAIDGYHVNMQCEFKRPSLNEFIVDPLPDTPVRRFSGEEELLQIVSKNE